MSQEQCEQGMRETWDNEGRAMDNRYVQLAAVNVNGHTEKKGNLTYLSWAWAVDQLLRLDPEAKWEYGQPEVYKDGTMMIFCRVTAFGISRQMQLPVMDYKNKAIPNPDAFQINTAMQRCLVKAIALHGLGLYIYAGEDLPPGEAKENGNGEDKEQAAANDPDRDYTKHAARQVTIDEFDGMTPEEQDFLRTHADQLIKTHAAGGDVALYVQMQKFDNSEKLALWSLLPSQVRSAIKRGVKPSPAELASQG